MIETSCQCTNKCGPELCKDGYKELSSEGFCHETLTSSDYKQEVCKNAIYCFKPKSCAVCDQGYVHSADGGCVADPCAARNCPSKSKCHIVGGFPECRCRKGYVMTFNNETLEQTCQTVVDAVQEDKELLPTDETGASPPPRS